MQVIVIGTAELKAQLGALPGRLRHSAEDDTDRAVHLEAEAIRADTPHRTATLAGSVQVSVTRSADGARGRVSSDLRYAPFVEHGTRRHGAGRHMFERGSQQSQTVVEGLYRAAVDTVAASFR